MQRTNSVTADYTGTTGATILDVDIAVRYACIHHYSRSHEYYTEHSIYAGQCLMLQQ
jgi:hypothetical protein